MTHYDEFVLGEWTVHPMDGRLSGVGGEKRVQPKTMDVLLCLVKHFPGVVERDALLREVWGERAQSDEPLTRCIGDLRRALGDSRDNPAYITTIPKRGYRLLQEPIGLDEVGGDRPSFIIRQKFATTAFVLVILALIGFGIDRASEPANPSQHLAPATTPHSFSVAVMPFVNMGSEEEQEYFSDGISEELISLLSRIPGLRVTSRSSAFSFKGRNADIPTIAQQLNVSHVLEGSVRRSGDRVRITVQLVDVSTDTQVWSDTYQRTPGDIFATQDEIAAKVAEKLKLTVRGEPAATRLTDPEAYSLVLQGKFLARQGSRETLERAVAYFQEAIAIDPEYAPAWAYLSHAYSNLAGQGFWAWDEGHLTAREAAQRAISIDPNYATGYLRLAWIAHRYDNDLVTAIEYMKSASQLGPRDVEMLSGTATLFMQIGQLDKSIALLEYCVSRSPVDPRLNFNLGVAYVYAGKLQDAEERFRKVLQLSPAYNGAEYYLGETLLLADRPAEALLVWQQLDGFNLSKGIALAAHDLGRWQESDNALSELVATWGDRWPGVVADVYAYRGDIDRGFEWLERDFEKYGAGGWGELKQQRLIENLKKDPRWLSFLEEASVTDAQLAGLDFDIAIPDEDPESR